MATASAWKNFLRMFRLACTRLSSLACSAPIFASSGLSAPLGDPPPLSHIPPIPPTPLPASLPPAAPAPAPCCPFPTFLILILLALTSLVCHPPTATTIAPAQYAHSSIRLLLKNHPCPSPGTSTPSPPVTSSLTAQLHGARRPPPSIHPAQPPSMRNTIPNRPRKTPAARRRRCRSRSVGHLRRWAGREAMWRLMTRSGERRKPERKAPGMRTIWKEMTGVGERKVGGMTGYPRL